MNGSVRLMKASTSRSSDIGAFAAATRSSSSIAHDHSLTAAAHRAGHSPPRCASSGILPSKYLPIIAVTRLGQLPTTFTSSDV